MKKLFAVVLIAALLLSLAACGGEPKESGEPNEKSVQAETVAYDYSGCWVCVAVRSQDGETDIKIWGEVLNMGGDNILSFELLEDYAVLNFMGQAVRCEYQCSEEGVSLKTGVNLQGGEADSDSLVFKLEEDGRLSLEEGELGTLLLSHVDERPQALINQLHCYFLPNYTPEETNALADFMNRGTYLRAGDGFFGRIFQRSTGRPCLAYFDAAMDKDGLWPTVGNGKLLLPMTAAYHLYERDDYLYFFNYDMNASDGSISRVKKDGSSLEILVEDGSDYLQIVGDRMFYINDEYKYCSASLDGSDVKVLFDKEIFYAYQVKPGLLMYQDDADHESLHLRDIESGADVRIAAGRVYSYGILDNYLFFAKVDGDSTLPVNKAPCRIYRMDLTKPAPEYSEEGELLYAYAYEVSDVIIGEKLRVYSDWIVTANDGAAKPEEWKSISDDSYNNLKSTILYRDDEWYIYEEFNGAYTENLSIFSRDNAHGLPYLYIEDIA